MKVLPVIVLLLLAVTVPTLADGTRYVDYGGKIPAKGPLDLRLDYTAPGARTLEIRLYNATTTFFSKNISIAAYGDGNVANSAFSNWLTIGVTLDNISPNGAATLGAATLRIRMLNGTTQTYSTTIAVTITAGKQGFHVWNGKLYDAREVEFVPRGVNNSHIDGDDGTGSNERYINYHELDNIRRDGHANAVRIVWKTDNLFTKNWVSGATAPLGGRISGPSNSSTSGGENIYSAKTSNYPGILKLEKIIQKCIEQKMIPMVELHDVTGNATSAGGDPNYLKLMAQFWADNVWLLIKYRQYVIVNIANEWSTNGMMSDLNGGMHRWRNAYIESVRIIRNAGFSGTLVVDCPAYAQHVAPLTTNDYPRSGDCSGCSISNTRTYAQNILSNDSRGNVMFSLHMYAEWATSVAPAYCGQDIKFNITTELQNIKNKGIPFLVGEFGHKHSGRDKDGVTRDLPINYWAIMRECVKHGFGFFAWSWCGNGSGVNYLDVAAGFSWTPYSNGSNFQDGHSGNAYVMNETYYPATLSRDSNRTTVGTCTWGGGEWGTTLVNYYDANYNTAAYNNGNFGLNRPGVSKLCSVYDVNTSPASTEGVEVFGMEEFSSSVFPNPVRDRATFRVHVAQPGNVSINVTDVTGRQISFHDSGYRNVGTHEIEWRVPQDRSVPRGIYIYRVITPAGIVKGKMLIAD
jgi:mannan endo-1,4-beta-mannosidase